MQIDWTERLPDLSRKGFLAVGVYSAPNLPTLVESTVYLSKVWKDYFNDQFYTLPKVKYTLKRQVYCEPLNL